MVMEDTLFSVFVSALIVLLIFALTHVRLAGERIYRQKFEVQEERYVEILMKCANSEEETDSY